MAKVVAPDGSAWTVRRRWFPWRRALSLTAIWHSTPDGEASEATPSTEEPAKSANPVAKAILTVIGIALWLIITAGKALIILITAVVVVLLSMIDLLLQLLVMPFVLVARACGVTRWPVQIDRNNQHFRTDQANGFSAAAALCDDLTAQIQRGELVVADTVTSS